MKKNQLIILSLLFLMIHAFSWATIYPRFVRTRKIAIGFSSPNIKAQQLTQHAKSIISFYKSQKDLQITQRTQERLLNALVALEKASEKQPQLKKKITPLLRQINYLLYSFYHSFQKTQQGYGQSLNRFLKHYKSSKKNIELLPEIEKGENKKIFQAVTQSFIDFAENSKNFEVIHQLAQVYSNMENYSQASRLLRVLLKKKKSPELLFELGKIEFNRKNPRSGKLWLAEAVQLKPELSEDIKAFQKNWKEKQKILRLERSLKNKSNQDAFQAKLILAKYYRENSNIPKAELFLKDIGLEYQNRLSYVKEKAFLAFSRFDMSTTRNILRNHQDKVEQDKNLNGLALLVELLEYFKQNRLPSGSYFNDIVSSYSKFDALEARLLEFFIGLVRTQGQGDFWKRAESIADKFPTKPQGYYLKAFASIKTNKPIQALAILEEVLEQKMDTQDEKEVRSFLASLQLFLALREKNTKFLEQFLQTIQTIDAKKYKSKIILLAKANYILLNASQKKSPALFKEAEKALLKVLKTEHPLDDGVEKRLNAIARNNLGFLYLFTGKMDKAYGFLSEQIHLGTESAAPHINYIVSLLRSGQNPAGGAAYIYKILKQNNFRVDDQIELLKWGAALLQKSSPDKAEQFLKRAKALYKKRAQETPNRKYGNYYLLSGVVSINPSFKILSGFKVLFELGGDIYFFFPSPIKDEALMK